MIQANATGSVALVFTPSSDFNGAITVTSFKRITAWSIPYAAGIDTAGTSTAHLRGSQTALSLYLGPNAGVYQIGGAAQYNVGIGTSALMYPGGGYQNTAVGYGAMNGTTSSNPLTTTAVGYNAGFAVTSALGGTLIGVTAGYKLTSAVFVTLIGYGAGYNLTTGSNSVGVGASALYGLTTGSEMTAIGNSSGRSCTTATMSVFLGNTAGYHASQLADGTNMIAIGYGTYCDKSNQVVLGNSSVTETLLRGLIGLSQTSPTAVADIAASTTARASMRIRAGVAPTVPNDGDLWYNGTNLCFRDGTGTTRTLSWT
jgi:hypothetical protein